MVECVHVVCFCDIQDYIVENELAYAIYDINAVSEGHALVCLKDILRVSLI